MERRRRFDDRVGKEAGLRLSDLIDQIPEDRREKARSALAAAFGRSPVTALQPLIAGASALSYRIEVSDRPYLLRLESAQRDEVRDPHRAYLCLRAAAEAGIAPAVHHADPAAAVAILDFVPERPLSNYPGGAPLLVRDLGSLVNRLQATPAFPPVFDYPALIGILLGRLIGSGLFAAGMLEPHRHGFERIREAYPWDSGALVSSHNTSIPGIFFSMASDCGWSTGRRPIAMIPCSMLRPYRFSSLVRRTWNRLCCDLGLVGSRTMCCVPASA